MRVKPSYSGSKVFFAIQYICFMLWHPKYYHALLSAFLYLFYSLHLYPFFPAASFVIPVFISHCLSFFSIPLPPTPAILFILLLEIYN